MGIVIKRAIVILMAVAGLATVHACYDPGNVFAVHFNAGESVDPDIIATMGEEGVNYRVNTFNVYTFRSHYNPSIMVSLYKNRINFVIDASVIQLEGFPYGICIRTELEWLVEAGILAMDRIAIEKVEEAYAGWNASGVSRMGPVYWTKQDTLLSSDISIDEDGNFLYKDCGGADPAEVDLPPQPLVATVRSINDTHRLLREQGVSPVAVSNNANRIFDISGRLIHQKSAREQAAQSGIVLLYDRSGTAERILTLP